MWPYLDPKQRNAFLACPCLRPKKMQKDAPPAAAADAVCPADRGRGRGAEGLLGGHQVACLYLPRLCGLSTTRASGQQGRQGEGLRLFFLCYVAICMLLSVVSVHSCWYLSSGLALPFKLGARSSTFPLLVAGRHLSLDPRSLLCAPLFMPRVAESQHSSVALSRRADRPQHFRVRAQEVHPRAGLRLAVSIDGQQERSCLWHILLLLLLSLLHRHLLGLDSPDPDTTRFLVLLFSV
jgi:hypothetical protein